VKRRIIYPLTNVINLITSLLLKRWVRKGLCKQSFVSFASVKGHFHDQLYMLYHTHGMYVVSINT
jgi:hypothetical protein